MQEIITTLNQYFKIAKATKDPEQLESNIEASNLLSEAYNLMREDDMPLKFFFLARNNFKQRVELCKFLRSDLKIGEKYTNRKIKKLLKAYYETLGMRNPRVGSFLTAKIEDFIDYNFFITKECSVLGKDGKTRNGIEILGHLSN